MADALDLKILDEMRRGLPLVAEPYRELAERVGIGEPELLARTRDMLSRGEMRRMGASLDHRRLGFTHNAMAAFKVPPDRIRSVGEQFAQAPEVSHCYERAPDADWPYNLYAVVHGRSRDECEAVIARLRSVAGPVECVTLYSVRRYKQPGASVPFK